MAEWRSWLSRRVHIPKIVGSSPTFATMMNVCWGVAPNHQKPLQSVYLCADLSIVFLLSFGAWRNAVLRKKLLLDVGRLLSQDFVFIMNSFLEWLFADNRSTSGNDSYRQVT